MGSVKYSLWISGCLLALALGCSSNSSSPFSPNPTSGSIKLSIKTLSATASAFSINQVDSVTITSARIVIAEVELETSQRDSVDFEFEDPFVQDLVIGSDIQEINTVDVPFGIYEELEIEIDKLKAEDGAVFTNNPDLQNLSIRVEGSLNGDPTNTFVFTSDLSEEQEREFDPPLVIDATSPSTNIVLTVNTNAWFVDGNGNFIDPTLPENQDLIENNIKDSLEMFEDEDDDGEDDDDDSDDDDDNNGDDVLPSPGN